MESHREQMTDAFLLVAEAALKDRGEALPDEAALFSYALAFLVKWREPRALSTIVKWLSLPGEGAFDLGGDTVTEWGSRMLATVCSSDLDPIKQLILDRNANEYCRGLAIEALAILAAWNERTQTEIADYFGWLAREGLEREPTAAWDALLSVCADIEATAVFGELRRAADEGLLNASLVAEELSELRAEPAGSRIARFGEVQQPFDDVAKETRWWACFSRDRERLVSAPLFNPDITQQGLAGPDSYAPQTPYLAPPKIGRNEPCPCGSGKKYKKCCGC